MQSPESRKTPQRSANNTQTRLYHSPIRDRIETTLIDGKAFAESVCDAFKAAQKKLGDEDYLARVEIEAEIEEANKTFCEEVFSVLSDLGEDESAKSSFYSCMKNEFGVEKVGSTAKEACDFIVKEFNSMLSPFLEEINSCNAEVSSNDPSPIRGISSDSNSDAKPGKSLAEAVREMFARVKANLINTSFMVDGDIELRLQCTIVSFVHHINLVFFKLEEASDSKEDFIKHIRDVLDFSEGLNITSEVVIDKFKSILKPSFEELREGKKLLSSLLADGSKLHKGEELGDYLARLVFESFVALNSKLAEDLKISNEKEKPSVVNKYMLRFIPTVKYALESLNSDDAAQKSFLAFMKREKYLTDDEEVTFESMLGKFEILATKGELAAFESMLNSGKRLWLPMFNLLISRQEHDRALKVMEENPDAFNELTDGQKLSLGI